MIIYVSLIKMFRLLNKIIVGLIVKDLHFRQKGMKIEIEGLEKIKSKNKNYINSFETEVSECYQAIQAFKLLIY